MVLMMMKIKTHKGAVLNAFSIDMWQRRTIFTYLGDDVGPSQHRFLLVLFSGPPDKVPWPGIGLAQLSLSNDIVDNIIHDILGKMLGKYVGYTHRRP